MKKILLGLLFLSTISLKAQYCVFFDFKAENQDMVVSTITAAMNTEKKLNINDEKLFGEIVGKKMRSLTGESRDIRGSGNLTMIVKK